LNTPDILKKSAADLARFARAAPERWQHWATWYEDRVQGGTSEWRLPKEQDAEMARRLIKADESFWDAGPAFVHAKLDEWLDELRATEVPATPEPQSEHGLIFERQPDGAFAVSQLAGADELLTTPEAVDRHAELKDTLDEAARRCSGHNQAVSLVARFQQLGELMGGAPSELRIGRFLQRGELCLKLAEAMVADLRGDDGLAALPLQTREVVLTIEAVSTAYWAMVNFDPALARRAQLHADPDKPQSAQATVSFESVSIVIGDSISNGILQVGTDELIAEMGEGVIGSNSPDPRRERRFWETVRNFPRAVLGWAWANKGKAGAGVGGLYGAAQWIVAQEGWLLQFFVDRPAMVALIKQLAELARLLPPPV